MNNRLLRIILIITPIAIVIAAAALLFVIIFILNPEWELTRKFIYIRETVTATSMAAMVVATLFLAWATFSVINNDRQREERDRKERLLNEIIEWAIDISKCGIDAGIDYFMRCPNEFFETEEDFIKDNDNIERKETERRYWSRLLSEYLHLSKKSGYIEIIATKKIKKEALDKSIKKLVDELEDQIKVIRQGLTSSENITTTMINVQRDKLKECLDSAIDTATNLLYEIT